MVLRCFHDFVLSLLVCLQILLCFNFLISSRNMVGSREDCRTTGKFTYIGADEFTLSVSCCYDS